MKSNNEIPLPMTDLAIMAAAKTLHYLDKLTGETGLEPWSDDKPCESCIIAVTPLVEAARPFIEAEVRGDSDFVGGNDQ